MLAEKWCVEAYTRDFSAVETEIGLDLARGRISTSSRNGLEAGAALCPPFSTHHNEGRVD